MIITRLKLLYKGMKSVFFIFLLLIKKDWKRYGVVNAKKPTIHVLNDLINWLYREGKLSPYYFAYRLHEKGQKTSTYLAKGEMDRVRLKVNKVLLRSSGYGNLNTDLLFKHKYFFSLLMNGAGFPVLPFDLFFERQNVYAQKQRAYVDLKKLPDGEYMLKHAFRESGEGVVPFYIKGGEIYMDEKLVNNPEELGYFNGDPWGVQKCIRSHQKLRQFNHTALNTTRIFTLFNGESVHYLGGYQVMATGDAVVDSGQYLPVYVAIDPRNNHLGKIGVTSLVDTRPGILEKHPDSDIEFNNCTLPYLKEAKDLCIDAHQLFDVTFIIGWDIAITDDGPLILEANERPGIQMLQLLEGGIREKIFDSYQRIKSLATK